jgi:hypothetical protein
MERQTIQYNGKTYKLPFNVPKYFMGTDLVNAQHHFTDEIVQVPRFVLGVRNGILYYEYNASLEDKRLGDGGSKLWDNVRKGLNWFRQYFAKEYMDLLD